MNETRKRSMRVLEAKDVLLTMQRMLSAVSAFLEHVKPPHIFAYARSSMSSSKPCSRGRFPARDFRSSRRRFTRRDDRATLDYDSQNFALHSLNPAMKPPRWQTTRDCPNQRDGDDRCARQICDYHARNTNVSKYARHVWESQRIQIDT